MNRRRYSLLKRLLGLFALGSLVFSCGSRELNESTTDTYPLLFETPSFELIDTGGQLFPSSRLKGHAWLVDFIFSRCGGPCPLMSKKLGQVQRELKKRGLLGSDSRIRLVSITVDPEYDTPEVLAAYAERWEANPSVWHFLTGPSATVREVVEGGFKTALNSAQSSGQIPEINHGTAFLLVGPDGWVRKILRIEEPDFIEEAVRGLEELSQISDS